MSDEPEEDLVRRAFDAARPAGLDARVLAAAAPLLARNRRRAAFRRTAAAAAALLLGAILWRRTDDADRSTAPPSVAGGGTFVASAGSRARLSDDGRTLILERGSAVLRAGSVSLALDVPGGRIAAIDGEVRAEVVDAETAAMRPDNKWIWPAAGAGGAGLAILVAVLHGAARIEDADGARQVRAPHEAALLTDAADGARARAVPRSDAASRPDAGTPVATSRFADPAARRGLRGVVRDAATGEPVAGVVVRRGGALGLALRRENEDPAAAAPLPDLYALPSFVAAQWKPLDEAPPTDAQGRFVFAPTEAWYDHATATAPGYAASVVGGLALHRVDDELVLRLERPRTFLGRLVDPDRRPIGGGGAWAKAQVFVPSPTHPELLAGGDVALQPDASFRLTLGAAERVRVLPIVGGYSDAPVDAPFPGDVLEASFVLTPTGFVAGRVVGPDGAPVAGVPIDVTSYERKLFVKRTRRLSHSVTDAEGRFRATAVADVARVSLMPSGFAAASVEDVKVGTGDLEIRLEPLVTGGAAGRVLDARGEPLPGVALAFERLPSEDGVEPVATTDAQGTYKLVGLRPGTWRVVYRRAPQRSLLDRRPDDAPYPIDLATPTFEIAPSAVAAAPDLRVVAGGTVFATTLDDRGAPRSEGMLSLVKPDLLRGDHDFLATVSTGDDGRARFDDVPPGSYALVVGFGGRIALCEVRAGETTRVTLGGAPAKLVLRITEAGRPAARAPLLVASLAEGKLTTREARTNDEGRAEIADLPAGDVIVRVGRAEGLGSYFALATAAKDAAETELRRPRGVVRATAAGAPFPSGTSATLTLRRLEGLDVDLSAVAPPRDLLCAAAVADETGTLRFDGVAPGLYRVETRGDGPARRIDVCVAPGVEETACVVP